MTQDKVIGYLFIVAVLVLIGGSIYSDIRFKRSMDKQDRMLDRIKIKKRDEE